MGRSLSLDRGPREGGVVLILTLFVILITYALVAQLTLGTSVASQTTRNAADRIRMRAACMSAAQEILETLSDDAGGAGAGSGMAASMGEGMAQGMGEGMEGPGGDGFGQGPIGDSSGEPGGEGEGDDGSESDSFEDAWARRMRIVMNDVEIEAWVQDENAKFNLLTMLAEDEELREDAKERYVRILDRMRDEFEDDLSYTDARRILEQTVVWLEARDRDEERPRPLRHSNSEEEDRVLMFALEELLLLEDVDENLFYDQLRDNERIAPGLESLLTVWTSIDLEQPGQGETGSGLTGDGEVGEPFGQDGERPSPTEPEDPESPGALESPATGGLQGAARGQPAIGARVNLNTTPRVVLESLMDESELPRSIVNEILEYRNEVDEEAIEEREAEEYDPDERALERALYGEDEPDPKLYFKSLEDLDEIESLETLDQVTRQGFLDLIGVQSDVFSVYLFARIKPQGWMPEERFEEPPGPVLRLRAVVWRRVTDNGAKFLYLLPWHEVPYTRWRIPDFPERQGVFVPPMDDF